MITKESPVREALLPKDGEKPSPNWAKIVGVLLLAGVLAQFASDLTSILEAEFKQAMDGVLQLSLLDVLMGGWATCYAVEKALADSKEKPKDIITQELIDHTVKSEHHPYVEFFKDGLSIKRIDFVSTVKLEVKGAKLKILNGEITDVLAGTCEGSVKLEYGEFTLAEESTEKFDLPGSIPLKPKSKPETKADLAQTGEHPRVVVR